MFTVVLVALVFTLALTLVAATRKAAPAPVRIPVQQDNAAQRRRTRR